MTIEELIKQHTSCKVTQQQIDQYLLDEINKQPSFGVISEEEIKALFK